MSVQKLAGSARLKIEKAPYTMILTDVIQGIKDNDALRLYLCLADKPQNWNVVKSYAEREAGIGQRKAKQCWSYLNRCGLIKYLSHKDDKGKIMRCEMMILNGSEFNAEEPFALNRLLRVPNAGGDLSTGAVVAPVEAAHFLAALPAVKQTLLEEHLRSKRDLKTLFFGDELLYSFTQLLVNARVVAADADAKVGYSS